MRVLIVDDSSVVRMLLRSVMEGVGCEVREADNGERALQVLLGFSPDIVTMDVHMPGMDGYETTARILERYALPVVVLTASANASDAATAMRALEAGALAVLEKPTGPGEDDFERRIDELLRTLRNLSQVKIVRRPRTLQHGRAPAPKTVADALRAGQPRLVAIAASAGGPVALKALLPRLSAGLPWPMLLAQHIAPGFLGSFRDWLASLSGLPVLIAEDGQVLQPGQLYLAPDGCHLGVSAELRVQLDPGCATDAYRPSANHLFFSVAQHCASRVVAIQLSGMGRDGAEGLAELHRRGALTIVQEPASAVIDAMPQAAIQLHAASKVLAPEAIVALLNSIASQGAATGVPTGGE